MIWLLLYALAGLNCLALNAHLGIRDRPTLIVVTLLWPFSLMLMAACILDAVYDRFRNKTV